MRTIVFATATLAVMFAADSAAPSNDQQFEQCRAKLVLAQKLGMLYDLDWKPHSEPYVVVGATFMEVPIDAKEGLATTVNCFLMAGDTGKCMNFDVLHWQTGKAIGRFENCRFRMK
jgi:hypothetical protein